MIKDAGARWTIIGHSERRQYFCETDATVNKRMLAVLATGLAPIVCIGETLQERVLALDRASVRRRSTGNA